MFVLYTIFFGALTLLVAFGGVKVYESRTAHMLGVTRFFEKHSERAESSLMRALRVFGQWTNAARKASYFTMIVFLRRVREMLAHATWRVSKRLMGTVHDRTVLTKKGSASLYLRHMVDEKRAMRKDAGDT